MLYYSSIENQENVVKMAQEKLAREAQDLRLDHSDGTTTIGNPLGLDLLRRMDALERTSNLHREMSMHTRQRNISTWIRNRSPLGNEAREEQIRYLNKEHVHGGNILLDTLVLRERFSRKSTEYAALKDLYGLTMEEYDTIGMVSTNLINTLFVTNIF